MTITKDDVITAAKQLSQQLRAARLKALEVGIYDFYARGNFYCVKSEIFNEFFARGAYLRVTDLVDEFPVMAISKSRGIWFRAIYSLEEAKKAWGNSRIEKLLREGAE